MARRFLLIAAASIALAACDAAEDPTLDGAGAIDDRGAAADQPGNDAGSEATVVRTPQKAPLGAFLVDGGGRSLYMLEADRRGADGTDAASNCAGGCAREWPPLLTSGDPQAGEGVQGDRLSTLNREDGGIQVTYGGWPLYRYHDDSAPGDTAGQGVHDAWGGWYLVAPSGEKIEPPPGRD